MVFIKNFEEFMQKTIELIIENVKTKAQIKYIKKKNMVILRTVSD